MPAAERPGPTAATLLEVPAGFLATTHLASKVATFFPPTKKPSAEPLSSPSYCATEKGGRGKTHHVFVCVPAIPGGRNASKRSHDAIARPSCGCAACMRDPITKSAPPPALHTLPCTLS